MESIIVLRMLSGMDIIGHRDAGKLHFCASYLQKLKMDLIEFGMLLRLVDLMNLITILSSMIKKKKSRQKMRLM